MKRIILVITMIIAATSGILSQTNGTNTIVKSSLANGGGGTSSDGQFSLTGLIGQVDAFKSSSNGSLNINGGFWTSEFVPTAAAASISGRITTAYGRGIRNVFITLTDTSTNESRRIISNSFGYYRFIDVEVGKTYVLGVDSKRFSFNPNSRVVSPNEDLTDENFVAENVK
jgi:Carboxypeptidase regulatory-like domain